MFTISEHQFRHMPHPGTTRRHGSVGCMTSSTGSSRTKDATTPYGPTDDLFGPSFIRGFELDVIEGPDSPKHQEFGVERCAIGSAEACDLAIDDQTVSRFHCEIVIDKTRIRIRDLGSRNGTYVDGTMIESGFLRSGSTIRLGQSVVRFQRID